MSVPCYGKTENKWFLSLVSNFSPSMFPWTHYYETVPSTPPAQLLLSRSRDPPVAKCFGHFSVLMTGSLGSFGPGWPSGPLSLLNTSLQGQRQELPHNCSVGKVSRWTPQISSGPKVTRFSGPGATPAGSWGPGSSRAFWIYFFILHLMKTLASAKVGLLGFLNSRKGCWKGAPRCCCS